MGRLEEEFVEAIRFSTLQEAQEEVASCEPTDDKFVGVVLLPHNARVLCTVHKSSEEAHTCLPPRLLQVE